MTTPDNPHDELEQARQALRSLDPSSAPEQAAELRSRVAALEAAAADKGPAAARALLRDAAKGLLAIGAINVALSLAMYFASPANMFTFNFGLLLGAAMLWSCNLRAASLVRWFACAYLGIVIYWLFVLGRQPPDLTLSYLRLYPLQVLAITAIEVLTWIACLGLARQLGRDALMQARAAAGKRRRDMRIPFALGCIGAIVGIAFFSYLLSGPRLERAETLARQSTGPGYRYYTEGMRIVANAPAASGGTEKQVTATVAAWNKDTVYHIPVAWREP
jgi:hypothetical protein